MKRFMAVAALIFLSGCVHLAGRPSAPEGVRIAVYLEALPRESEGLRFSLSGISAVGENGTETPLHLVLSQVRGADEHRQQLLAEAILPPGNYAGLAVRAGKAWIAGEDGEASLNVLPEPANIAIPFEAKSDWPVFIPLKLRYRDAVGTGFSFSPAFSPAQAGREVAGLIGYVTSTAIDTVVVFDKESLRVTGLVGTGRAPRGVVFDQLKRRAYIALSGDDAIDVVDMITERRIARIRLSPGDAPRELVLLPDGKLLSVNEGTSTVSFVDTATLAEKGRVPVGEGPVAAVVDPAGRKAFVICATAGTVSVVDLVRRNLITSVSTDPEPIRGAFSREGDSLTIIHSGSAYVTILDPRSLAVTARRYVGGGLRTIRTDSATGLFYLSRRNGGRLEIVDPVSLMTVDSVVADQDPTFLTVDGELNRIFLLEGDKGELLVLDGVSKQRLATIDAGSEPYAVAVMGER